MRKYLGSYFRKLRYQSNKDYYVTGIPYLNLSVRLPYLYGTSVVDLHWFHVDPDPHLAFLFNADPNPVFDDQ
jgi:hypothetical protein